MRLRCALLVRCAMWALGTLAIVLGSALQSAGLPRLALAIDGLVLICVLVPALAVVSSMKLPVTSIWVAVAASYCAFALAYAAVYGKKGLFRIDRITSSS